MAARTPGGPQPRRMVFRTNLLFALSGVFAMTAFAQDATGLVLHLAAFAALLGSGKLTRDGIAAEDAFAARTVAHAPALPRKLIGAGLTGIAVALGAIEPQGGVISALILGMLASVLHVAAFGLDPMRAKGTDAPKGDRVARVIDEAEVILSQMQAAIAPLGDRDLSRRVSEFAGRTRAMCRAVETDPRDLTGARRYLGVYLQGARDATAKFAEYFGRTRDPAARTDYETLLADLSATYAARTERMIEGDRIDLDVEIGVLRDRLSREAVGRDGPDE